MSQDERIRVFPVIVQSTERQGRFIVGTKDIKKGEYMFAATAYASCVIDSHRKRTCGWCLRASRHGQMDIVCPSCKIVFYCSEACQDQATTAHIEGEECIVLKRLTSCKLDLNEKSLLQLLLPVLRRRSQEQDLGNRLSLGWAPSDQETWESSDDETPDNTTLPEKVGSLSLCEENKDGVDTDRGPGPDSDPSLRKQCAMQAISPLSFADVDALVGHPADDDMKKFLRYLRKAVAGTKIEAGNEDILGCDDKVLSLCYKLLSNGFGLYDHAGRITGRILYPLASFFNHSCDNNCDSIRRKGVNFIRANRDISQGEELCISYIDSNKPVGNRREQLLADYNFHCICSRCCNEENNRTKVSFKTKKPPHNRKEMLKKKLQKGKKKDRPAETTEHSQSSGQTGSKASEGGSEPPVVNTESSSPDKETTTMSNGPEATI